MIWTSATFSDIPSDAQTMNSGTVLLNAIKSSHNEEVKSFFSVA